MGSGLAENQRGFWWQFHQEDLCDLQKSLHSQAPSFLIHQMSGHLIFKTLSSDEHLKMMSCLERPHSLEACFFSSNPEPDD